MAYLGSFAIDDYVGIPAATHRFSSGAAYAPTTLTYSIYEEATAVGLYEDVDMVVASPFDSIVGCYWVRVQLTALAGFESGKNYLVVVKATVDSVSAIQMHTFQVQAKVTATTVSDKTGYTASTVSDKTGYSLAASQTFNVTGNLSGSVGSVTGAVGSVTAGVTLANGAHGGAAATLTLGGAGGLTGDITGTVSTVTTLTNLPAITTDWITAAGVSAGAVTKVQNGLATPTNITAGTITTVTNLTNAPTAGDFTSTMKTSLNAATPAVTVSDKTGFSLAASQTFSMTGNITGNLSGSVGSVTGAVGSVTGAVGSVTTVSDKTGYSLAATGLDSITATRPSGKATTFPAMLVQLFYRMFGKVTMTATQLKTYAADGTTVVTTQTVSDDATTQTQGEAS